MGGPLYIHRKVRDSLGLCQNRGVRRPALSFCRCRWFAPPHRSHVRKLSCVSCCVFLLPVRRAWCLTCRECDCRGVVLDGVVDCVVVRDTVVLEVIVEEVTVMEGIAYRRQVAIDHAITLPRRRLLAQKQRCGAQRRRCGCGWWSRGAVSTVPGRRRAARAAARPRPRRAARGCWRWRWPVSRPLLVFEPGRP